MGLLSWIIFGALAGWIASLVTKTDAQQGALLNIIIGVIGAVIGGMIMNFLGMSGVGGFNFYSLVVAVIGAVAFISIVRAVA